MSNKILIPIKSILIGRTKVQQIEEFEFVRNNPIISTLGAAALGGAAVHDYHKNGYNSVGGYIGDKFNSVKNSLSNGLDKAKETFNHQSSPEPKGDTLPNNHSESFQTNSFKSFKNNISNHSDQNHLDEIKPHIASTISD